MLFTKQQLHHKMKTIRSNYHELKRYDKVSLSYFDDKRYLLDEGVGS